jgi:hypothetical protein
MLRLNKGVAILLAAIAALVLTITCNAEQSVLSKYLEKYAVAPPQYQYHGHPKEHVLEQLKRNSPKIRNHENELGNNPCVDFPDHPFPCKHTDECLPISYVCDKNKDCQDGSDEDPEMCTAAERPPMEEIESFLNRTSNWILPTLFGNKSAKDVAHKLAVSPTLKEFGEKLGLNTQQVHNLKLAMEMVKNDDRGPFESIGMPRSQWHDVALMFFNLINTGFDQVY